MNSEVGLIVFACVQRSTVRVQSNRVISLALAHSRHDNTQHQLSDLPLRHGLTNDSVSGETQDYAPVQPAFACSNVGYIAHPFLLRLLRGEIPVEVVVDSSCTCLSAPRQYRHRHAGRHLHAIALCRRVRRHELETSQDRN